MPVELLQAHLNDWKNLADYKQIVSYFRALTAASPRVQVADLGKTTLGEDFIMAVISSEANMKSLDRIRETARKLADPRGLTDAQVDALARDGKAIVLVTCNIHSSEIASSQMAMEWAYDLARATDAETRRRLDNVILHPAEPRVLAVLDWELSTLGDPLADLSYHLMQWVMPRSDTGADTGSLVGLDLAALGIPSLAEYVDAYAQRTGLDPRAQLPVYLAYNFFRLAAIVQGIVGRVRDGTATSEHAAARAVMVRPLAEQAWAFAREAGA